MTPSPWTSSFRFRVFGDTHREQEEAERRQLYVAVTRAERVLYLVVDGTRSRPCWVTWCQPGGGVRGVVRHVSDS